MNRKIILSLIFLLLFGCLNPQQRSLNNTYYDMKMSGFVSYTSDNKFIAAKAMMIPPGKINNKMYMKKVNRLNSQWFNRFITLNSFTKVLIDKKTNDLYGKGIFLLDGSMNTYFLFDFIVSSDKLIGLKFYNWKVYCAPMAYRSEAWTRDFEDEFSGNIPYHWPVIKRNFLSYFNSYEYEVIQQI